MKTSHEKTNDGKNEVSIITIRGRSDEFAMVVDALLSSQDERIQKMGQYIRKAVGIN